MGSCLSSCSGGKTAKGEDDDRLHRRRGHGDHCGRQDRASSPDEEPVVKEVLSETPKPSFTIPNAQPPKSGENFAKLPMPPLGEVPTAGSAAIANGKAEVEPEPEPETEVSEICSVSETVSVSTTFTDRGEMEEESKRRVVEHRSANAAGASGGPRYRKKRSLSGELTVPRREPRRGGVGGRSSRSPARRADSGGATEYAFGRALSSCREGDRVSQPIAPRLGRRDPGERSGRRSVSPAAKRVMSTGNRSVNGGTGTGNGLVRVAQAAQPGKASIRVPPRRPRTSELHDSRLENPAVKHTAAAEAPSSEQHKAATGDNGDDEETLENPLVALECFIFL